MRNKLRRGAVTIEMTLIGIPVIFSVISIFEMSRGVWMYHTMAAAMREGVRYATVHGINCATAPNACTITAQQVATRMFQYGAGLNPSKTHLTFISGGITNINNVTLKDCLAGGPCTATWPVSNGTGAIIEIQGIAEFNSAIAMFWPGSHPVSFAKTWFPARSADIIQF